MSRVGVAGSNARNSEKRKLVRSTPRADADTVGWTRRRGVTRMTAEADNQSFAGGLGRLTADDRDLIARAETLRRLPSTRSDLGDEIGRGLALMRNGEPTGARVLEEAVEAVANFKHIVHADGDFYLSMHVRGMLDSAYSALESSSAPPEVADRIREAVRLIGLGDEAGVAALETALAEAR